MSSINHKYKIEIVSGDRNISITTYRQKKFKDDNDILRYLKIIGKALRLPSVDLKSIELIR